MTKKIKVLLADNNRELCHVLTEHISRQEDLELLGIAYDGLEAVELVRESQPDVLVLDISMPYLDGIGVMERLEEITPRPKIIVLTAFDQESMVQRMIGMGVDYYIVKPFDTATLLERIRQFGRFSEKTGENKGLYRSPGVQLKGSSKISLEMEITKLFHEMGIPAHFRGYAYLREAIIMAVQDVAVLGNITKNLYPKIAEKYHSTSSGVESAIRHTIEVGWERGNYECFRKIFGLGGEESQGAKGKFPTSASFIAKVGDKMRLLMKMNE